MSFKRIVLLAGVAAFVPVAALAAHGKAGLWSSTTTVDLRGMPPQSHTATYCMTQAEVNSDTPANRNPDCKYQNVQVNGHMFSADMICTGKFKATGHFQSTYDSDTHYTATVAINTGEMSMTNKIEGKWLRADCAGATHP